MILKNDILFHKIQSCCEKFENLRKSFLKKINYLFVYLKQAVTWLRFNPLRVPQLAPFKVPSCDGGGPSLGKNQYPYFDIMPCALINLRLNKR